MVDVNDLSKNQYMVKIARLVETLSTCPRLQDIMFLGFFKKHEKSKTVCSKYFYDIWLHMHKNGAIYKLDHVDINFLENSDIPDHIIDSVIMNFNRSAKINSTNNIYHDSF